MALKKDKKAKIVGDSQIHAKDTGSVEVQVSLLSEKITVLSTHLQTHKKDIHSRRGLLGMVSQRRRLLSYLKSNYEDRYTALVQKLGLRK